MLPFSLSAAGQVLRRHLQSAGTRLSRWLRQSAGGQHVQQMVQDVQGLVRQHPRLWLVAVAGVCSLGAGAAVAVVDKSAIQRPAVRQVYEQITPALSAYLEQEQMLSQHALTLYRSTQTRPQDTVGTLLARMDVRDQGAESYIRHTDVVRAEVLGIRQRYVQAEIGSGGRLKRLHIIWQNPDQPDQYKKLVLSPNARGVWSHQFETGDAEVTTAVAYAVLSGAYYRSTQAAGIPAAVADQVLDILEPQADVLRDIRRGDTVTVVYERLSLNGLELGTGRVLSTSVRMQGRLYQAVWLNNGGKGDAGGRYYTPAGEGLSRAYLSSPVPGARITSPFERYRVHPIFGDVRSHTGVDYGAPSGTPVQVVADGVVSFAGWQTGYGNVIIVQHGGRQSTLYAHLSRMQVAEGAKVRQGQVIGRVGSTGWSTGPHLHFETRDNNVPQNPEKVLAERRGQSVTYAQRKVFAQLVAQAQRSWDQAQSIQLLAGAQ